MIQRDLEIFTLKALLKWARPMTADALKREQRAAFQHVALTNADLDQVITCMEEKELISGTNDDVLGPTWDLTPKGKIKAQQLR